MRKILFVFIVFSPFVFYAQNVDTLQLEQSKSQLELSDNQRDSLINDMALSLEQIRKQVIFESEQSRYKIYKTDNLYNLLKLNTQTGQIEQIQWNLDSDYEGTVVVNDVDLSLYASCFELYPTNNMYQFILLDKTYGRTWHVFNGVLKILNVGFDAYISVVLLVRVFFGG